MLLQQLQRKYEIVLTHITSINLSGTYGENISLYIIKQQDSCQNLVWCLDV